MNSESELQIMGEDELRPVTRQQLELALRMLGHKSTVPEIDPHDKSTAQPQTVAGVYQANRAERRATASKRNGPSRNGRPIQRRSKA